MPLGQNGYAGGAIADQTLLLRDIRTELSLYNLSPDPWLAELVQPTIRQTLHVAQGPKAFRSKADGGKSVSELTVYRDLNVPFKSYDLNSDFTPAPSTGGN